MKNLILIFFLAFSINSYSQTLKSNVEFVGNKIQVLQARADLIHVSGKLSTGEIVNTGCDHGACYFRIEYKGRTIQKVIGGDITKMTIYEYDFGGDGDNELV